MVCGGTAGCVVTVDTIETLEATLSTTSDHFRSLVAELAAEIGRVYGEARSHIQTVDLSTTAHHHHHHLQSKDEPLP
jgi:hypothetical protein